MFALVLFAALFSGPLIASAQDAEWLIIDGSRNFSYNVACLLAEKEVPAILLVHPDHVADAEYRLPQSDALTLVECDYTDTENIPVMRELLHDKKFVVLDPEDSCFRTWQDTVLVTTRNLISAVKNKQTTIFYPARIYPFEGAQIITKKTPYKTSSTQGETFRKIETLLKVHADKGHCTTRLLRVSYPYGPAIYDYLLSSSFKNFSTGGPLTWLFTIDKPHQFCYAKDVAELFWRMSKEAPSCAHEVIHFPGLYFESVRQFGQEACDTINTQLEERVIGSWLLFAVCRYDHNAQRGEDIAAFFENPPTLEQSDDLKKRFDFTPTPHKKAARETIDWFRAHPETRGIFKP